MPRLAHPKEVLEPGRVKGGMIRSHLSWIDEHRTAEEKKALLARLSPDEAHALTGPILATAWVPFSWLIALDRAIIEEFGRGNPDLLADLGRYSARINLSTTYRAFTKDDIHEFFNRSAVLHSQFQDFGSAAYEKVNDTHGRMIHRGYTVLSPVFCSSAIGYYEGAVAAHGGKNAVVRELECQCYGEPTCTFDISWS